MKRAYKAVLHGDRVEWLDGAPESDGPVEVQITIETNSDVGEEDEEITPVSHFFQVLADLGTFDDIDDPVAWQREIRKDRPLPGRE